MEVTGFENLAFTGSAQPYRRHIIGLPLQRSLFHQAALAATTISLPGLTSQSDFPARLDKNGDLFLDRSQIVALSHGLLAWFTSETVELMHGRHSAACDALVAASENASCVAASSDSASARKLMGDLANKMALVLAYGILSKFVPDLLLRALADLGDVEQPPFPEMSAGAKLVQDTFGLYQSCDDLGYNSIRLQSEWPSVPPQIIELVREFCRRQTGFGPLAWEAPGYEDPAYVVRLLHSAFDQVDTEQVRRRLTFAAKSVTNQSTVDLPAEITTLRRALGFWLDFLERETWYVRRAFFVGMIPLLQQLAVGYGEKALSFQSSDLLFLDIQELTAGTADPGVLHARRDRYMKNTDYLSLHGVDPNRLAGMVGNS